MPRIDRGLAGTKQVTESELSLNVKGNRRSITAAEKRERGGRSQEGGQKEENQLQRHG